MTPTDYDTSDGGHVSYVFDHLLLFHLLFGQTGLRATGAHSRDHSRKRHVGGWWLVVGEWSQYNKVSDERNFYIRIK